MLKAWHEVHSLAWGSTAWRESGCQRQLLPWSLAVEIDMNILNSNSNSQENLREFGECRNLEWLMIGGIDECWNSPSFIITKESQPLAVGEGDLSPIGRGQMSAYCPSVRSGSY